MPADTATVAAAMTAVTARNGRHTHHGAPPKRTLAATSCQTVLAQRTQLAMHCSGPTCSSNLQQRSGARQSPGLPQGHGAASLTKIRCNGSPHSVVAVHSAHYYSSPQSPKSWGGRAQQHSRPNRPAIPYRKPRAGAAPCCSAAPFPPSSMSWLHELASQ